MIRALFVAVRRAYLRSEIRSLERWHELLVLNNACEQMPANTRDLEVARVRLALLEAA